MLKGGSTRGKPKKVVEEEEDAKNKVMSAAAAWAGARASELDLPKSALSKSSGGARSRGGSTSNSDLAKSLVSKENGATRSSGVGAVSQPQSTQVGGYAVYRQLDPQLLSTLALMLTDIVQTESLAQCHTQILTLLDDLIRLTGDQALQTLGQMDEIQEAITVHQINLKRKRSQSASSSSATAAPPTASGAECSSSNNNNAQQDVGDESEDISLAESKDQKMTSRELLTVPGSGRAAASSSSSGGGSTGSTGRSRTAARKKHHKKKTESKRSPKEIELVCSRIEQITDAATLANALSTLIRTHPEVISSVMGILKIDPSETIQEALLGLSSTRANYLLQYPQAEPESEAEN